MSLSLITEKKDMSSVNNLEFEINLLDKSFIYIMKRSCPRTEFEEPLFQQLFMFNNIDHLKQLFAFCHPIKVPTFLVSYPLIHSVLNH